MRVNGRFVTPGRTPAAHCFAGQQRYACRDPAGVALYITGLFDLLSPDRQRRGNPSGHRHLPHSVLQRLVGCDLFGGTPQCGDVCRAGLDPSGGLAGFAAALIGRLRVGKS